MMIGLRALQPWLPSRFPGVPRFSERQLHSVFLPDCVKSAVETCSHASFRTAALAGAPAAKRPENSARKANIRRITPLHRMSRPDRKLQSSCKAFGLLCGNLFDLKFLLSWSSAGRIECCGTPLHILSRKYGPNPLSARAAIS